MRKQVTLCVAELAWLALRLLIVRVRAGSSTSPPSKYEMKMLISVILPWPLMPTTTITTLLPWSSGLQPWFLDELDCDVHHGTASSPRNCWSGRLARSVCIIWLLWSWITQKFCQGSHHLIYQISPISDSANSISRASSLLRLPLMRQNAHK